MELETAFLAGLGTVRGFRIERGSLALLDETGAAVIYLKP